MEGRVRSEDQLKETTPKTHDSKYKYLKVYLKVWKKEKRELNEG